MKENMEYDMILSKELDVLASTVKQYTRSGWVPKGEIIQYKDHYVQELERHPVKSVQRKAEKAQQKTWIPWSRN